MVTAAVSRSSGTRTDSSHVAAVQVLPDMLKNAPMFKKVDPKHKGKGAMGMGGVGMGAGRGGGGTRRLLRLLEFALGGQAC